MSDTVDDENGVKQLLDESQTRSIREQMRAFVAEHDTPKDLKAIRQSVADGDALSDLVVDGRDERVK